MKTALISGASIAGPALAFWLTRAGYQVTVVERAIALRPGGYKIDVRGAAITVIERMGLYAALQACNTDMIEASVVDDAGKRISSAPAELFGMREGKDLELMRGDLSQILYAHTQHDVRYIFGDSITSLREDATGVAVQFSTHAPQRFDIVVGADGLHSKVRALTFGDEAQFVRHLGHYVSIFSVANTFALDRRELVHALARKIVNVYSTRGSDDCKALFMFKSAPLSYDRHDIAAQKKILSDAYAGAGWQIPALLAQMDAAKDFYFDSLCTIDMPRFSQGRIVLIGDAAHCASPASGQGTSMAIVGAYMLAHALVTQGDHSAAFSHYETEMRDFVTQNQKLAQHVKQMVPASAFHLWLYKINMKLFPHVPWAAFIARQIQAQVSAAANNVRLPASASCAEMPCRSQRREA